MTLRPDRWAITAARIAVLTAVTGLVVPEIASADPDQRIGRQGNLPRDNRSMDLLRYLLTEHKAYELETTDGRASRVDRVQDYQRLQRFMTWASDPTRFAPSPELAQYIIDPKNQWEIKSTLGDFAAAVGAEDIVEAAATEGAYHLLLEAAGHVLGVSLGAGALVVAPVLGMPNDLGQLPQTDNPSHGERHSGIAGGGRGPSILDGREAGAGVGARSQSTPRRADGSQSASGNRSSQNGGTGSSYRSTTYREPEHRDNRDERSGSTSNREGPTKGPDRPNEPKNPRSVEGHVSEGSGFRVESYRPGKHPDQGDQPYYVEELPLDENARRGTNGNDVGHFRLPSGARDKRSGLTRMDVRSTTGRSPFEIKTGPTDEEEKRAASSGRQPSASGTNDLGNDLPFRKLNAGSATAAPLAEQLWWQRNGVRAQPPK